MTFKNQLFVIIIVVSFFHSCSQKKNRTDNPDLNIKQSDSLIIKTETSFIKLDTGVVYDIDGHEIEIRLGPGEEYDKLINKKATEIFEKTQYANVDHSVKIKITEQKGNWSKIRVVEPDWLINTHIGWIPSKYIIEENRDAEILLEALSENFLISLLENINNKEFVKGQMDSINFTEKYNGIYVSNKIEGGKNVHWIDIISVTEIVTFHTAEKIYWEKICVGLKKIKKQEEFYEEGYKGRRYITNVYTFETLEPKSGVVNLKKNKVYDIYVYKTERYKNN